ncbi:hypothetical protein HF576_18770 [Microbacterium sp. CFH 90308]|uniref:Uncharacterized protein n=1 Tax=Microbacterium salsuginis TaxID=2722803 RepID=A0ABX1KHX0_9MICO|nr:hypothetical protein [Microbacterium sp. CFH 90308]NLP85878.1 hypothetical protein [Microbacterium sp. CFH 90308]
MQFAEVLPEDAPDPRLESGRRLLGLRFPLMGLVPQPAIEDVDRPGIMESTGSAGRSQLAVSFSYTFWRNPDDRADPVNLKDLEPEEQASIETVPPWPRPAWLIEAVEMMRYPRLWEAVRTCWSRDVSEYTTLQRQLVDHTNHILTNQFREELGLAPGPTEDGAWMVRLSSVNTAARLEIDGVDVPAVEIDTDPFVYAVGAQLRPDVVTTVVIARDHLPYVRLALHTRTPAAR